MAGTFVVQWSLFFFSSRRRHTRFDCDWSSDVCSSDLQVWEEPVKSLLKFPKFYSDQQLKTHFFLRYRQYYHRHATIHHMPHQHNTLQYKEIGRASCRERV